MTKKKEKSKVTIPVTRSSMPPIEEYIEEINELWNSRFLTNMGPKARQLQHDIEIYLNVQHLELFVNGHLALEAALQVLPLQGEVITTPFTFSSTTQAILHSGLTPVFCDIDPDTYTIDPEKIEPLITENTCAILPVHVYGNPCDHEKINAIAQKYHLKVIYDAAHAFGETVNGVGIGTWGDISMFSFHATKVFHTVEGGGLTFHEEALCKDFAAWRQFGMYEKEDSAVIGTNAKMTEFHAAMGICNLRHLEEEILKRKKAVTRYMERLEGQKGIKLNPVQRGVTSNYAYFPVVFDPVNFGKTRDEVIDYLEKNGIYARRYFQPLTSEMTCMKGRYVQPTPIAKDISERVLTLPLFADMTQEMVDRVCDVLIEK